MEEQIDNPSMRYWTWTGKVSPSGSKRTLFIPSEAIRKMGLDPAKTVHITIKKEISDNHDDVWTWTSGPIVRGTNLVLEIPPEAVAEMTITKDDYMHVEIRRR